MIDKVRDIVDKLTEMGESVKVDDVQSRLKTVREDTVRQLRDKNELYVDGKNVIQFGKHNFSVNTQPLELTTVIKDGDMFFHLSGTNYFEAVANEALLATKTVWDQPVVSENRDVYRGEYLAYLMLQSGAGEQALTAHIDTQGSKPVTSSKKKNKSDKAETSDSSAENVLLAAVQTFMAPRYSEGYVKGVHDHDAAKILAPLLALDRKLGLLKYSTQARTLAGVFWLEKQNSDWRTEWENQFLVLKSARQVFGTITERQKYVETIEREIEATLRPRPFADTQFTNEAANYLFDQYSANEPLACSSEAKAIADAFCKFLKQQSATEQFAAINASGLDAVSRFAAAKQWISAFVAQPKSDFDSRYVDEVAMMLIDETFESRTASEIQPMCEIIGLLGDHRRVESKTYHLDYNDFVVRLNRFANETVPAFEAYVHLKKEVIDGRRQELKLNEFKPRVLTSFVRNQLINDTYLPMVGANLAKQIGVVGEDKRTDLMGLLLLVSPPGYGKTTLMEYIANRLGITFMKINGPAIGHQVKSLDPNEAPNASAREEVEKLNLALEMGDNVMIYLDDIQHCNPEFLQKFISLCDATRRIEGVFGGKTKTYDLRGRKVAVVMAGNPYTESGEKFQIPDMLASRADTYNLGDVIGGNEGSFELSYLENCLTSNSTLAKLNSRSRADVYSIIKMAREGDDQPQTLEGNYSIEEINEFVAVMRKLVVARDVILRVNREYIDSAAQADEFRTEPAFKLQGSYRDMNKIAEQIAPIMNDEELDTLIDAHYLNQAQTLTSGAQANLLKLKELIGKLQGEDLDRWNDIKRTFKRNLMLGAAGDDGQLGQVIAQMTTFSEGLHDIRSALDTGVKYLSADQEPSVIETATMNQVGHAVSELSNFNKTLGEMKTMLESGAISALAASAGAPSDSASAPRGDQKIEIVNKVPNIFLDIIRNQFRVLQTWMEPILKLSEVFPEADGLKKAADATRENYEKLIGQIGGKDSDKK
jgi:hypothetical protein